jgi:ribonuclease HII
MFQLEKENLKILGLDEVGRGPLAGPVVVAGVFFNKELHTIDVLKKLPITDSKKLSSQKRQEILNKLSIEISQLKPNHHYKFFWGEFYLKEKSPKMIDKLNILGATMLAMKEIFLFFEGQNDPFITLIDGNRVFDLNLESKKNQQLKNYKLAPIVKGDLKCLSIALASIIAKEYRDQLMKNFHQKYPDYGFHQHAGYPTRAHKNAIKKFGPTPIHRKSFNWL